jgi:iron-sulfur cluster repair protein YtfE (RIC family)
MGNGDGFDALVRDHRYVANLFDRYFESGDEAFAREIFEALAVHTQAEEQVLYPLIELQVPGGAPLADRAADEHAVVSALIARLEESPPHDLRPTMEEMRADVEAHVGFEEQELFPKLRQAGVDAQRLGVELRASKEDVRARH